MEQKGNSTKLLAIIGLMVATAALAVGYAAYSATLTIENAEATVTTTDTFKPNVQYKDGTLSCVKTGTETAVNSAGSFATDASGYTTIWQNASVTLEGPGNSVTCKATIENKSSFTAYLKSINVADKLICNPATTNGATQNLADACAAMTFNVGQGSATASANSTAGTSNSSVSGVSIAAGGNADVSFTIAYPSNAAVTDGDFVVSIPKISFVYETTSN